MSTTTNASHHHAQHQRPQEQNLHSTENEATRPAPADGTHASSGPDTEAPWLFGSFFLGGFECSMHVTPDGRRLDQIAATQHDIQARSDYRLCTRAGIRGVREATRWHLQDRAGRFRLGEVARMARIGREEGVVQIWDLMHYGYPDDLDPLAHPAKFIDRFASYAGAVARVIAGETPHEQVTYYTPVNEISYYSWTGGQLGTMAPFGHGRGGELKRVLVRAALAASEAIWEADPRAIMVTVDPLIKLHPPPGRPDLQDEADSFNTWTVNEAYNLICGRVEPELGGSRRHLGIVGFNYYSGNQWTLTTAEHPQRTLSHKDPEWTPLSQLMLDLERRYGGPILFTETSAVGADRAPWLEYVVSESVRAREMGVDLQGVCLYPIITAPDWADPDFHFDAGFYDVVRLPNGRLQRLASPRFAEALRAAQAVIDPRNLPPKPLPRRLLKPE